MKFDRFLNERPRFLLPLLDEQGRNVLHVVAAQHQPELVHWVRSKALSAGCFEVIASQNMRVSGRRAVSQAEHDWIEAEFADIQAAETRRRKEREDEEAADAAAASPPVDHEDGQEQESASSASGPRSSRWRQHEDEFRDRLTALGIDPADTNFDAKSTFGGMFGPGGPLDGFMKDLKDLPHHMETLRRVSKILSVVGGEDGSGRGDVPLVTARRARNRELARASCGHGFGSGSERDVRRTDALLKAV